MCVKGILRVNTKLVLKYLFMFHVQYVIIKYVNFEHPRRISKYFVMVSVDLSWPVGGAVVCDPIIC